MDDVFVGRARGRAGSFGGRRPVDVTSSRRRTRGRWRGGRRIPARGIIGNCVFLFTGPVPCMEKPRVSWSVSTGVPCKPRHETPPCEFRNLFLPAVSWVLRSQASHASARLIFPKRYYLRKIPIDGVLRAHRLFVPNTLAPHPLPCPRVLDFLVTRFSLSTRSVFLPLA